jgi:hypothetical protein
MRSILNAILNVRVLVFLIVTILILILLQSNFSWALISFGQLFAYPEIRFHHYSPRTAEVGRELFSEDVFAVENRGSESANEVYLSVVAPAGRITRYDLFCQEPYVITGTLLHNGRMGLWLERLTPDAKVVLYVWSATEAEAPSPVEFSVTAQRGTVKPSTEPTAAEEVESYLSSVEWVGRQIFHFLQSLGLVEKL